MVVYVYNIIYIYIYIYKGAYWIWGLGGPTSPPWGTKPVLRAFEGSGNQSVFRVPISDLQNDSSSPKVLESDSKQCPKMIPKPPK